MREREWVSLSEWEYTAGETDRQHNHKSAQQHPKWWSFAIKQKKRTCQNVTIKETWKKRPLIPNIIVRGGESTSFDRYRHVSEIPLNHFFWQIFPEGHWTLCKTWFQNYSGLLPSSVLQWYAMISTCTFAFPYSSLYTLNNVYLLYLPNALC